MKTAGPVTALAFVSNGISAEMARAALERDGHALAKTVLIKQRRVDVAWSEECARVIEFARKPSLTLFGQVNMIGFYATLVPAVHRLLRSGTLRDIYIPNIDNLLTNHVVESARRGRLPGRPRVSVVAEGFMNYQDIGQDDRAGWRWAVKPWLARAMGLRYRAPRRHLSGSYEPEVARVFAYSALGLKSPPDKIVVAPYPQVSPIVAPDRGTALVVLTGIAQWMQPEAFARFAEAFARWVNARGYARVLVKPHPYYPSGGVEAMLDRAEPLGDTRRLEEMAAEIPAQTVIGYCTTGLVTLKLMRPDLDFIDWGSDFYCEHAYHGDRSVVGVLAGAGIGIVEMAGGADAAPVSVAA